MFHGIKHEKDGFFGCDFVQNSCFALVDKYWLEEKKNLKSKLAKQFFWSVGFALLGYYKKKEF